MGRPKKVNPTISKNIALPEDLVARIELELYSELEGKIPFAAQQQFFERVLREHFAQKDQAEIRAQVLANQEG
jgi:hypothetical protein